MFKLLNYRRNQILRVILLVNLFGILSILDQWFELSSGLELTVRLTTGFAFMVYLLYSYRNWLIIVLLQFCLVSLFNIHQQLHEIIILTLSETITSIASAAFFLMINKTTLNIITSQSILKILLSAIFGSLVGGVFAGYSLQLFISKVYSSDLWITWFLSSLSGIILMAPIIVGWKSIKVREIPGVLDRSMLELLLLIVSALVATHLIFNNKYSDIYLSISLPYLILPFIFWAAIRFHQRILSLLLFVVSLLILYYTEIGTLPFRQTGQPFLRIINSVQVFILFTVVFSYVVASIIQVRKEAEEKVKRLNEDLEERVMERTKALQQTLGALRQSEEQFREAFDTSIHGMAQIALDGKFIRANQAFCDMVGYPKEKLTKLTLRKLTQTEDFVNESKKLRKLIKDEISSYQVEKRLIHKDNLDFWVLQSNSLIKSPSGKPLHIVSQIVDITERKQVEGQLRKYTETLTVLLREVNHRVKNNLSALIGILHMEEDRAINQGKKGYIDLLREVNSRIRGLATVHSMLSAGNWQPLEISGLCEQIIQAVLKGLPLNKEVALKIEKSKIKIGSNQAHHLTLVINELATNSVKYGIGDSPNSVIHVKIKENKGLINILYRDNGPGFPDAIINGDFSNAGIGFELIQGIVTQSLDGKLILRNDNGAITEISFANELN